MTKDQMQAVIDSLTLANVELTAKVDALNERYDHRTEVAELMLNDQEEISDGIIADLTYQLACMTNDYYTSQRWQRQYLAQRDAARATLRGVDAAVGAAVRVASAKAVITSEMTHAQRVAALAAAKAFATAR